MSGSEREETTLEGGNAAQAMSACTELVPLSAPQRSRASRRRWSPDPFFVTHLIATRDQAPQTRILHRASPADAQTAYRTSRSPARGRPGRTDHVI